MTSPILELKDIHLPPEPGVWPPSPVWLALIAASLILLIVAGLLSWRYIKRTRAKRTALKRLKQFTPKTCDLVMLNTLLKQAALNYFPRHQVASLSGIHWLTFLDQNQQKAINFQHNAQTWLVDMYRHPPRQVTQAELDWAKTWLNAALPPKGRNHA